MVSLFYFLLIWMYYIYDMHGNVKTLVQELDMGSPVIRTRTGYTYDLISGNVNEVNYQEGYADEFNHRYYYDADNRITRVETSKDGIIWEKEAKYFYYKHGPLARTEIGDKQVQGTDHAYTIQGWIKGVNSTILNKSKDMGLDGYNSGLSTNDLNEHFGADAFSYLLGYFNNDYKAISNPSVSNAWFASLNNTSNPYNTAIYGLYNGNISSMVTSLFDQNEAMKEIQGAAYRYDQLNRIRNTSIFRDASLTTNNYWANSAVDNNYYKEEYHYDNNGNITNLKRYNDAGTLMDDFTYKYQTKAWLTGYGDTYTNMLRHVNDAAGSGVSTVDIDDQGAFPGTANTTENYFYDEIGELIKDASEEIESIEWTMYKRIKKLTRISGSNKNDLEFIYDVMGDRIIKIVKPRSGGSAGPSSGWVFTYYSRDADGKVMATYTKTGLSSSTINLTERCIYGSKRLGSNTTIVNSVSFTSTVGAPTSSSRVLGNKVYELSNHLGNVLVTLSDRKIVVDVSPNDGVAEYYTADVLSYTDYYSFGMVMPNRNGSSSSYRYGFNGKENDNEWNNQQGGWQDYGMRMYDPRLCRFSAVDPLTKSYPELTPYQFASNTPIQAIDLDGGERSDVTKNELGAPVRAKFAGSPNDHPSATNYDVLQLENKVDNGEKDFMLYDGKYKAYWDPNAFNRVTNKTTGAYVLQRVFTYTVLEPIYGKVLVGKTDPVIQKVWIEGAAGVRVGRGTRIVNNTGNTPLLSSSNTIMTATNIDCAAFLGSNPGGKYEVTISVYANPTAIAQGQALVNDLNANNTNKDVTYKLGSLGINVGNMNSLDYEIKQTGVTAKQPGHFEDVVVKEGEEIYEERIIDYKEVQKSSLDE